MIRTLALGVVAVASLSSVAVAAPRSTDPVRSVEASAQVDPRDGGAQIELANAYVRAGRSGEAATAYRRALTLDNVMLETRTGDSVWSHQVARHMLASGPVLAAR
jgi:hypothetical protein